MGPRPGSRGGGPANAAKVATVQCGRASMGPRPGSRGRQVPRRGRPRPAPEARASMGPRPGSRGGTPPRPTGTPPLVVALQWGHGRVAVEDASARVRVAFVDDTCRFNGATAAWPWSRLAFAPSPTPGTWLQWGHGRMAVEGSEKSPASAASWMLHWGHGRVAVEDAWTSGTPVHSAR